MPLDILRRGPVLIVAAHPDDETIGLGGQFGKLIEPCVIHVTDGAPRSISSEKDWAAMRRGELLAAMGIAGLEERQCLELRAVDQESSFSLVDLTSRLVTHLVEIRPQVVFTHPYEGGHPDHDACAFMVQAAGVILNRRGIAPPLRCEFASYHNGCRDGSGCWMEVGEFLPGPTAETIDLGPGERDRKQRMFDCFPSQHHMLEQFPIAMERLRMTPVYDFSLPPHDGKVFYEDKNWGVTGEEWRRLAVDALRQL
jgi:LmbE family N-acetylglucosaminyl deacetylase